MNRLTKAILVLILGVALLLGGLSSAYADDETPLSPPTATPVVDEVGDEAPEVLINVGQNNEALPCIPYGQGDHVHRSGYDASGHGWWIGYGGGCADLKAVVTIRLQQYVNNAWQYVGDVGTKTSSPGSGSVNRATSKAHCSTYTLTQWRSVIDVDIVGVGDPADLQYTDEQQLACRN